jgi:secreted trypsin-like serine protease
MVSRANRTATQVDIRITDVIRTVQEFIGLISLIIVLAGCGTNNSYPPASNAPLVTDSTLTNGIIGGSKVSSFDPIQSSTVLLIDFRKGAVCTASLLNSRWLLTAAHCVADASSTNDLIVGFTDSLDTLLKPQSVKRRRYVDSFIVNPRYASTTAILEKIQAKASAEHRDVGPEELDAVKDWGDLALVHMSADAPTSARPAKLLAQASLLTKGAVVTLAGYGQIGSAETAPAGVLMRVDVTIQDALWGSTEVLMDQRSGKGACHGDSGGPAFVRSGRDLLLFGVTSRGVGDRDVQCVNSAAYTNIIPYRQWIRSNTGI